MSLSHNCKALAVVQSEDVSMIMLLKGLAFVDQIEGPSEIKPSLNKGGHLPPLSEISCISLHCVSVSTPLQSSSS